MAKCRMWFCSNEADKHPKGGTLRHICSECFELTASAHKTYGPGSNYKSLHQTIQRMIYRAKDRNRYELTITTDDIYNIWPKDNKCPIMRHELTIGGDRRTSPSLDRIDSSKGYHADNIQVVCDLANKMKQNATTKELERFCKYYG